LSRLLDLEIGFSPIRSFGHSPLRGMRDARDDLDVLKPSTQQEIIMSENVRHQFSEEDEDDIFVNGVPLDPESVDSAIDALARDEAEQAEEALARARS
jgi:hypothetical protein